MQSRLFEIYVLVLVLGCMSVQILSESVPTQRPPAPPVSQTIPTVPAGGGAGQTTPNVLPTEPASSTYSSTQSTTTQSSTESSTLSSSSSSSTPLTTNENSFLDNVGRTTRPQITRRITTPRRIASTTNNIPTVTTPPVPLTTRVTTRSVVATVVPSKLTTVQLRGVLHNQGALVTYDPKFEDRNSAEFANLKNLVCNEILAAQMKHDKLKTVPVLCNVTAIDPKTNEVSTELYISEADLKTVELKPNDEQLKASLQQLVGSNTGTDGGVIYHATVTLTGFGVLQHKISTMLIGLVISLNVWILLKED